MALILSLGPLWGHDTSVALLDEGNLIWASSQERHDRVKHSSAFPSEAIEEMLRQTSYSFDDIDCIAIAQIPNDYIAAQYIIPSQQSESRKRNFLNQDLEKIRGLLTLPDTLRKFYSYSGPIFHFPHHLCHLSHAFYTSKFDRAIGLSIDGAGETVTALSALITSKGFEQIRDHAKYPDSLGLMYASITDYLGFLYGSDEGIIMGLAPYGNSNALIPGTSMKYLDYFDQSIDFNLGQIKLLFPNFYDFYNQKSKWVGNEFLDTLGPRRNKAGEVTQHHMNIAAAAQDTLEKNILLLAEQIKSKINEDLPLVYSGGVSLNCSANGQLLKSKIFSEIYVPAGSGDEGTAIGAAILAAGKIKELRVNRGRSVQVFFEPGIDPTQDNFLVEAPHVDSNGFRLGSRFTNEEILKSLSNSILDYREYKDHIPQIIKMLLAGKIGAIFDGPAEFGARALGNRSIVCAPFPGEQKDYINSRVKFREDFRPFAPAVLFEDIHDYFDIEMESSPYMLFAVPVLENAKHLIPAVTHVDGSARVQSVFKESSPVLHQLIHEFKKVTGIGVLLNTSFNVKGQPIVDTPAQALETFNSTNIDFMIIGNWIIEKQA